MISNAVSARPTVLIGDRLELLVDQHLMDRMDNESFVRHHPVDRGSVLQFDKKWEGVFRGYVTVVHDENRYRLYYRGLPRA